MANFHFSFRFNNVIFEVLTTSTKTNNQVTYWYELWSKLTCFVPKQIAAYLCHGLLAMRRRISAKALDRNCKVWNGQSLHRLLETYTSIPLFDVTIKGPSSDEIRISISFCGVKFRIFQVIFLFRVNNLNSPAGHEKAVYHVMSIRL